MTAEFVESIGVGAMLAEGVTWDHRTGEALWTDIHGRRLYRYRVEGRSLDAIALERRLTAFGLTCDPNWLIAAFDSGFAWVKINTGADRWIDATETVPGRRMNDGRIGPDGRFWCGSMVEDAAQAGEASAGLYRLERDAVVTRVLDGVSISNGLAWSPDGGTMYFADSSARTIWAFDYDGVRGVLTNRRVFATTPDSVFPDGSCVDAAGGLWNAQWGGGRVARYRPGGELDYVLELPVSQPSCVAFGGVDLDLLFVTTAREQMSDAALAEEPLAGDVLVYRIGHRGLQAPVFAGRPPEGLQG